MAVQKNSFVTIAEQIQLLNNNNVEVLTKINDVVVGEDSSVNVTQLDEEGNETTYSLPTVGKLQKDIENLNNNVQTLAGLNNNTVHVIDGTTTKKIFLSDLNREPNKIDNLSSINQFDSNNNWFFESLMNPSLTIDYDLSDKVGNDVDGVISRRYIIKFKTDKNGDLTDNGAKYLDEFNELFLGKNNIKLQDFLDWHTNPTNTGIYRGSDPVYDEEKFKFDFQEVDEYGVFSVVKQEVDTINNKLWFHIYPSRYTSITNGQKILSVDDELILNSQESVTKWKIIETSTASSEFRIRLERLEGYDPIATGANVLKIYGSSIIKKIVKVTVGFDENLVIFMKATNSKNNLKSSTWSNGTALYTNDLILDTDANLSMSQYYLDYVEDYGKILNDMITKVIPSNLGLPPNLPILDNNNFNVVQINKHLTDTDDSKVLKDLHSEKTKVKTKLEQVNTAIIQKNRELSVSRFPSVAEKTKSQNELGKLSGEQESQSKLLYSITRQIKSKTDTTKAVDAKFRVRGFWDIPEAKQDYGYRAQEIVQFQIQYRYSSKTGVENQTEGFRLESVDGTIKNAYFANWVSISTDLRTRTYNKDTSTWSWDIEDVSDADTPNINQLDISISADEKVEIKVRSISEVGYPDSIIYSEWSDTLTMEFPDNLKNVLGENEFILQEANEDNIMLEFEQSLDAKGVIKHVNESYYNEDEYIAHLDKSIITNYKDDVGVAFDLREYLDYLTTKISSLENIIYSAKGLLIVYVFNGEEEVEVTNNSKINIDVTCENGGNTADGVTFDNNIYINGDYYIKIQNISENSQLSFLVRDNYGYDPPNAYRTGVNNLPALVDINNKFVVQEANQFIYFLDSVGGNLVYTGNTSYDTSLFDSLDYTWLGSNLTGSTHINGLSGDYINLNRSDNPDNYSYSALGEQTIKDDPNSYDWDITGGFSTLICPVVNSIDDLIVSESQDFKALSYNEEIVIPINIYWKFVGITGSTVDITELNYITHTKSIRIRLRPLSIGGFFDFTITFNIKNVNLTTTTGSSVPNGLGLDIGS